jgi:uncharacterized damage-inducible protein DinB
MLLPEFTHEAQVTRKTLERVPFDKKEWSPHEKSYTLLQLAAHLAEIPGWTGVTVNEDVFEVDGDYERHVPETVDDLLEHFDQGVAQAREALEGASAETLMEDWAMKQNGEVIMQMPKAAVLRSFVFNHMIHHRAQLGVYLRLLDVPVPATYGPSADEAQ